RAGHVWKLPRAGDQGNGKYQRDGNAGKDPARHVDGIRGSRRDHAAVVSDPGQRRHRSANHAFAQLVWREFFQLGRVAASRVDSAPREYGAPGNQAPWAARPHGKRLLALTLAVCYVKQIIAIVKPFLAEKVLDNLKRAP